MNGWRKADDATVPSVDLEIAGTKEKDSEPTSKARQPERSGLSEAKNLLFLRLKKHPSAIASEDRDALGMADGCTDLQAGSSRLASCENVFERFDVLRKIFVVVRPLDYPLAAAEQAACTGSVSFRTGIL
jgi:hypothetical protein